MILFGRICKRKKFRGHVFIHTLDFDDIASNLQKGSKKESLSYRPFDVYSTKVENVFPMSYHFHSLKISVGLNKCTHVRSNIPHLPSICCTSRRKSTKTTKDDINYHFIDIAILWNKLFKETAKKKKKKRTLFDFFE
jgi:hypothetical protein